MWDQDCGAPANFLVLQTVVKSLDVGLPVAIPGPWLCPSDGGEITGCGTQMRRNPGKPSPSDGGDIIGCGTATVAKSNLTVVLTEVVTSLDVGPDRLQTSAPLQSFRRW